MTTRTTADKEGLIALAERCEAATASDRKIDTAITFWLDQAGQLGPHETDRDGLIIPPPFTASLDAAMTLAEPFMLVALSDIAADGLTGCCLCSDTATNPPTEHWGIPAESGERQGILARAVCAAALRAQSSTLEGDR